jgi:hypothetical protein
MTLHVGELRGNNDRFVAIVCGAMVEGALKGLLKRYMIPLSGALHDSLFGSQRPLSTF